MSLLHHAPSHETQIYPFFVQIFKKLAIGLLSEKSFKVSAYKAICNVLVRSFLQTVLKMDEHRILAIY